jgi:hypothetical protein
MTILAGSAGKTPVYRPVDWIKDLARFDPPDRDLWVGGTEGRQPGQYPGHQPISRGGTQSSNPFPFGGESATNQSRGARRSPGRQPGLQTVSRARDQGRARRAIDQIRIVAARAIFTASGSHSRALSNRCACACCCGNCRVADDQWCPGSRVWHECVIESGEALSDNLLRSRTLPQASYHDVR